MKILLYIHGFLIQNRLSAEEITMSVTFSSDPAQGQRQSHRGEQSTSRGRGRSRRVQPIHCNVVCTSQVDDCTLKISEPPLPLPLLRCTAHGICTLDRGESPARAEERASERLPDRLPRCSAAPTNARVLPNSSCGEGSLQCLSLAVGCDLQVHHQRGPIVVHST